MAGSFPVDFLTIGENENETATDHYALWPHYRHERALADEYKTALHTYDAADAYRKARDEALRVPRGGRPSRPLGRQRHRARRRNPHLLIRADL